MSEPRWRTHRDARDNGWHSRRHQTREAQDAAREAYQSKARPAARLARASGRRAAERGAR